jgi:MraZ protein
MFRGAFPGTIDEKSRLKIPRDFRALIEERFGRDLFVTSLDGQSVRIYPMPVWLELEQRLAAADVVRPSAVRRFFQRVNYYGQATELDNQGRVLIHSRLRESAEMTGEVDVVGNVDFLEVWNHARMVANLERDGFTAEDEDALLLKRT